MGHNAGPFYQTRGFWATVLKGLGLYKRYWPLLSKPLLVPVASQVVGLGAALALPFMLIDWISTHPFTDSVGILWGVFALSLAPGLILFLWGFWQYLLWVSALNLAVRDTVDLGVCGDTDIYRIRIAQRSQDYSLIWLFFFALSFFPMALGLLPLGLGELFHLSPLVTVLLGVGVLGILGMVAVVIALLCALVFQVFAFTPCSAGAALFRSADLVKLSPGKTLALVLLAGFMTQGLLPALGLGLLDITGVSHGVGTWLHPGILHVLQTNHMAWQSSGMLTPEGTIAFEMLLKNPLALSVEIIRTAEMSIFSAMVLPLGTTWLALWYGHLKTTQEALLPEAPERVTSHSY